MKKLKKIKSECILIMSTYRKTELKKLETARQIHEQAMLNIYELFKRAKNGNTREKLKEIARSIQNKINKINNKKGLLLEKIKKEKPIKNKNVKAQALKEREAFKRKANSGFNSPVKNKKSAKK
tara:strand:+ start:570 stop:941 length:372 start_codon:yes stop_codon:yes gene_type:complete